MKSKKINETYGIIGLGRFGFALARTLAQAGAEIIVVDNSEENINAVSQYTDNVFLTSSLSKENLKAMGLANCDTVAVCIGEKIDTSIMTTLSLIQLGVKKVIAKAVSEDHGNVLKTLGAEVVFPESDMAVRLANKLLTPNILDYISLSDEIDIIEIKINDKTDGLSVEKIDLRKNFSLNIIAVKKGNDITIEIVPSLILNKDDIITVVGKKENIAKFKEYLE